MLRLLRPQGLFAARKVTAYRRSDLAHSRPVSCKQQQRTGTERSAWTRIQAARALRKLCWSEWLAGFVRTVAPGTRNKRAFTSQLQRMSTYLMLCAAPMLCLLPGAQAQDCCRGLTASLSLHTGQQVSAACTDCSSCRNRLTAGAQAGLIS